MNNFKDLIFDLQLLLHESVVVHAVVHVLLYSPSGPSDGFTVAVKTESGNMTLIYKVSLITLKLLNFGHSIMLQLPA